MLGFVIPYGHDSMKVNRLPFVTIAIIVLCAVVYIPASNKMEDDALKTEEAYTRAVHLYSRNHYLYLPPEAVELMDVAEQRLYASERKWLTWQEESPEEVESLLDAQSARTRPKRGQGMQHLLVDMQSAAGIQIDALNKEAGINPDETKVDFLAIFVSLDQDEFDRATNEMEGAIEDARSTVESSMVRRLGFVPKKGNVLGLITHQFLHAHLFHLVFNMLLLWLAAVKLEDIWPRWFFAATYLGMGVIAALAHLLTHWGSDIPMIGASGAVAGLMGLFLVRYGRTQISFFYMYWMFRIKPRTGTFEAPAYIMLPMWFGGELFNTFFISNSDVASSAHVGGFLAGVACGLALRFSSFEENILGTVVFDAEPKQPTLVDLQAFAGAPQQGQPSAGFILPRLNMNELAVTGLSATALTGTTRELVTLTLLERFESICWAMSEFRTAARDELSWK